MNKYTQRNAEQIRRDTNAILEKVKSRIYSIKDLRLKVGSPEHPDLLLEVEKAEKRVRDLCRVFVLDLSRVGAFITISVNDLVVAACTVEIVTTQKGTTHADTKVFCRMGEEHSTQKYLLGEAERYALSEGVKYNTVTTHIKTLFPHMEIGYVPYDVDLAPTLVDNQEFVIAKVITEARQLYDDVFENQIVGTVDPYGRGKYRPYILRIIRHVLGESVMTMLRNNYRERIEEWNAQLLESNISKLIYVSDITLVKKLVNTPSLMRYPVTYPEGSIVETLGDGVNRFMDLVQVKTYDLEEIGDSFYDEEEFYTICQGEISTSYVSALKTGVKGDNIVMTIEVSGVILAFCIITFKDVPLNENNKRQRNSSQFEPWVYLHLICARQYTGIGKRLMESVELFAASNDVRVFRLNALTPVIHWYYSLGFRIGTMEHGNDPARLSDEEYNNVHVIKVFTTLYDAMKSTREGNVYNHDHTEEQLAGMKNGQNKCIVAELVGLVKSIFVREPEVVTRFLENNEDLLLVQANYISTNLGAYVDNPWDQAIDNGIHMSKKL